MRSSAGQTLRFIAFGLGALAALFAATELANTVTPSAPLEPSAGDDPLQAELARCRSITPADLEMDTACSAAWAEHRRRFLGLSSENPEKE